MFRGESIAGDVDVDGRRGVMEDSLNKMMLRNGRQINGCDTGEVHNRYSKCFKAPHKLLRNFLQGGAKVQHVMNASESGEGVRLETVERGAQPELA